MSVGPVHAVNFGGTFQHAVILALAWNSCFTREVISVVLSVLIDGALCDKVFESLYLSNLLLVSALSVMARRVRAMEAPAARAATVSTIVPMM